MIGHGSSEPSNNTFNMISQFPKTFRLHSCLSSYLSSFFLFPSLICLFSSLSSPNLRAMLYTGFEMEWALST
ncbi:uncharacterized protein BO72DRAFT_305662 [Aspergillus fijiensis CBS 313.89]|uniref:Uncharacterized protein n=1 Tax=Aspergillus fijiensis CBS 313.89 TaxID=1448319 RepID=A0A8G1RUP0_9EURO|nr:uncharacterized protein BO72DRAFT_305662 [Aspergillus fijiensis CBS 313.89]RAK80452.1 hypothetical protein BO72DRAFT_305662 [Aspergillus fijiensis CBS 313.89]